ncbi:unnamed protein product [marine sediment metagenome]|uniref:Uncharacterized protein n=1 Tax=marine sediment metagenome TaxID=412755 RepID=X1JSM4_9ZZZZ
MIINESTMIPGLAETVGPAITTTDKLAVTNRMTIITDEIEILFFPIFSSSFELVKNYASEVIHPALHHSTLIYNFK